ncbi:MAG: DUF4276 family protein [Proteobacteria bacterium]|nr:DUF4276 family protein [Pseudomonadota bacterium]
MRKIIVLVEGETEIAIFNGGLRTELKNAGIYLDACMGKKHRRTGGGNFRSVRKELILLLGSPGGLVTTFFDYYGLPGWPGLAEAKNAHPDQAVKILGQALIQSLRSELPNLDEKRFFPYVQMHETECLLFSNPGVLAQVMEKPDLESDCIDVVNDCEGCESINNGPKTHASMRLQELFGKYKKGMSTKAHASMIVEKTGLATIREKCPNFNQWLVEIKQRAEQLGND